MANKILVARGTKARLEEIKSTLSANELVYSTDTGELGVKKADGDIEYFKNATDINADIAAKQDELVAGDNITIDENTNVISASRGEVDFDDMAYFNYAGSIYGAKYSLLASAWQDMKDSETVLFDIPLALAAPNQEMGGMTIDLYVGTNEQLQALYDACANETIPPPVGSINRDVYYVNNVATFYAGDISGDSGFPIPLYNFGIFDADDSTSFLVTDLTPLSMGLGLVLAKVANVSIPNNNIVIQQGFEFENESGIIIPNSVTSIGEYAFYSWSSNNQPLVISNSVTSIGNSAFSDWTSNNQPLVISNSVTSIGYMAFRNWTSNTHPLTIPNSVTSIGEYAFSDWTSNNQPLVISNSVTSIGMWAFYYWTSNTHPLTIPNSVTSIGEYAFSDWTSNNQPLVIPNSVTSIGEYAFYSWSSNNQPLVISNSVTSIGEYAFNWWSSVPYIEMKRSTPPTLTNINAFGNQNDAPIYVPDESVDDYKTATNWVDLADRIFPISDKDNTYTKDEIDLMIGDIESALDAILGV